MRREKNYSRKIKTVVTLTEVKVANSRALTTHLKCQSKIKFLFFKLLKMRFKFKKNSHRNKFNVPGKLRIEFR